MILSHTNHVSKQVVARYFVFTGWKNEQLKPDFLNQHFLS
jgi:hypothetical protein